MQSPEIRDIDVETLFPAGARFEVRGLLGRGANGIVYRVRDRETGRDLALKTLISPEVEQVYHLKAEFRSLAKIAHPNLVQLDELVVTNDACFFTMELVDGTTLSAWAAALSPEVKIERLKGVAFQLASGIAALHDAGKLHRDIKPTNILVAKDERAVLVDFGLCTELRLVERRRSALVGTLLYMAPEQAWGKPLSRAADWYALGAVLYEAIVGRLPFEEEGSRLLFAKEKVPAVPDGLSADALPLLELARALMDPSPDRRPPPDAVFAALGAGAPSSRRLVGRAPTSGVRPSLSFVGRASELAVLDAALADVVEGRPAVVHVEGGSGIGKTELVERFVAKLDARPGAIVLRGRCHPQESVSYNGFDGIVDELSEWMSKLDTSELADVLPADAEALQAIFPMFGRIAAIAADPDEPRADAYELRRRSFRALRELLSKMAERHTVAVVLDDVQWGGADTAALVADVFRPPYSPRVLLVLAYRSEEEERSTMLAELRRRAGILFDSVHRIALGPLDRTESCELAMQLLGKNDRAAQRIAEHIATETGGHPLFLRELALAVAVSEGPPSDAGRGPADGAMSGQATADLGALLARRIAELPETERAILELASVATRPLPRRVLFAAAGRDGHPVSEVVRLARKRLLRETASGGEPAVEPFHSRVRDAVLGSTAANDRRRRHRALADVLLAEAEPDADALVDQLLGAGDRAAAARFALVAAKRAHDTLAFDRAVHLYRVALDAADSSAGADGAYDARVQEPRWRIRARLAYALVDAGRSRDAADAFARAAQEAALEDQAAAADLERCAAEQFMRGGHIDEGIALIRRVLAASSVPYPSTHASAFATVLAHRARLAVRGFRFRPRPAEQCPADELARVDACWSAGLGHAWVDTTRAAAFQARYMLLALRAGEPSRVSLGLATEASQMAAAGGSRRTERARQMMERALEAAKQADGHAAHAFTLLMAGSIEFYGSRWREALTLCERAEGLIREHQSRSEWELMTAHTLGLASLAHLGELRALRRRQNQLLDEARERGNLLAAVCLACGPANIGWLAADDPAEAQRRADEALAPWKHGAFQLAQYLHLVATTQIALYRGDGEGALARITGAWPRIVSSMTLYIQNFRVMLRHLRARAALAAAADRSRPLRRARLLRLARSEASKLSKDDVPFAPPLALTIEAGVHALASDVEKSAELLAVAAGGFRELDMMLHAAAADHERGRLVGGDDGRVLRTAAEASMIDEDVASPERLAAMLVPGIT